MWFAEALRPAIFRRKINNCLPWRQIEKPRLTLIDVMRPMR
jgi:hypothetical protein